MRRICFGLLFILLFVINLSSAAFILVAAHDSSTDSKAQADYLCDGVNDQVEINAALTDLPSGGGTIVLSEGTFHCSGPASIILPANTSLIGQKDGSTTIHYVNSKSINYDSLYTGAIQIRNPSVLISDIHLVGTGWVYIAASHVKIQNVTVSTNEAPAHTIQSSFLVKSYNTLVEDIEFNNCSSIDSHGWGFLNDGMGPHNLIRNLRYINCVAKTYPGNELYDAANQYDCGFDLTENANIDHAEYIGCTAEGFPESGFHIESSPRISNITYRDCVSKNNGWKVNASYGAGFLGRANVNYDNCTSINNTNGFLINAYADYPKGTFTYIHCRDIGSEIGFYIAPSTSTVLADCESTNARKLGLVMYGGYKNIRIENFRLINASGDGEKCAYLGKDPETGAVTEGVYLDMRESGCRSDSVVFFEKTKNMHINITITALGYYPVAVKGDGNVDFHLDRLVVNTRQRLLTSDFSGYFEIPSRQWCYLNRCFPIQVEPRSPINPVKMNTSISRS